MRDTINIVFEDLGRMTYGDALEIQEMKFNAILDAKKLKQLHGLNTFYFVEHEPVYTLGKSGDEGNLIRKPEEVGAVFYHTSRGGDITYHGPGQIVGYPILDLEQLGIGLAKYIWLLEETMIQCIADHGLEGGRVKSASGVWLDIDTPRERKICAIGVRASRYVTMHGFAFNVNTDLDYFNHIVPCGIQDKGVTSLQQELGHKLDFEAEKERVKEKFEALVGMN